MTIAVVDYGAGNLRSVEKALVRAGGVGVVVTSDPAQVASADRVVLPGDGAFPDCRTALGQASGLGEALDEVVTRRGRPFLGICIGMQLLATTGEEYEETPGLDWIPGRVRRIEPGDARLKVPHMGWNTLNPHRDHALLDGLALGQGGLHAYFLHAYHLTPNDPDDVVASATYGGEVTAVVARGNVAGVQFHPEKSQTLGLALLANFVRWRP
ncbi:glutamine amidotransferase [Methylopila capsulata]|uniref:Imidazole glycerol phosphate synthase subunit HisH n=1 Tax=Methylopila capsulata TaxID=61654 RepID=A0A9W6MR30_9HYPH|nr:imidazole glycerol phosphate synthase subunit HisH [Methylopila capsulata]MBM7851818.1 glutamine amidotransferase [Methylopila capsulata]GLK54882.1 imidazole glycerol phosphate synthase subunit HisH [Methylopila capsulata]